MYIQTLQTHSLIIKTFLVKNTEEEYLYIFIFILGYIICTNQYIPAKHFIKKLWF